MTCQHILQQKGAHVHSTSVDIFKCNEHINNTALATSDLAWFVVCGVGVRVMIYMLTVSLFISFLSCASRISMYLGDSGCSVIYVIEPICVSRVPSRECHA